jgi:tetratricopeptide (TPR) repeat protein
MPRYNRDTLHRLYQIGGADLALQYAEMSEQAAEKELEVLDLRFFAADIPNSDADRNDFATSFPESSTRFLHWRLDVQNPWRYHSVSYQLLARFTAPDGSVYGESKRRIETNPAWDRMWFSAAASSPSPAGWPVGLHRVEILIDGVHRTSGSFSIVQDRPKPRFDLFTRSILGREENAESPGNLFDPSYRFPLKRLRGLPSSPTEPAPAASNEPKGLGLAGWLDKLGKQFGVDGEDEAFDPTRPHDDMAKKRRLMAIDRRYTWTLPRTQAGLANEKVLHDLKQIAADYEQLLGVGLPQFPFYTEDQVRAKVADALVAAGRTAELLRTYPEARRHYSAAADLYQALGKDDDFQRCRTNLAELDSLQHGNLDLDIRRLRATLAVPEMDRVDRAEAMIRLAALYSLNHDDYEAKDLLLQAESLLDDATIVDGEKGDPSGHVLGAALTQSLLRAKNEPDRAGPMPILKALQMNGLYRDLYQSLARIYQESDAAKAEEYRAKALRRENRATNDEFSSFMLEKLKGELGDV